MFYFQFVHMEISCWVHVSSEEHSIFSDNSSKKHNIGSKIQNCLLFYSQSCLFNLDETFYRNSQRWQQVQGDPSLPSLPIQVGKLFFIRIADVFCTDHILKIRKKHHKFLQNRNRFIEFREFLVLEAHKKLKKR